MYNQKTSKFKPGDIVVYSDDWDYDNLDYLISFKNEPGLWVNIVNEDWIDSGEKFYGEEVIGFFKEGLNEDAIVVGHYGNGSLLDAEQWYIKGKPLHD